MQFLPVSSIISVKSTFLKGVSMKKETMKKVFSHPPKLESERLLLRKISLSDVEDMYEYASVPEVTEYLLWSPHPDRKYTKEYLKFIQTKYAEGKFFDWAIVRKSDGKMIGTCGFTSFVPSMETGEIGYVLNPSFRGLGYMTEAVKCVLQFGFESLHLHRIEARFMQENINSKRLTERVGMQFEGYLREAVLAKGKYRTVGVSAILEKDWKNQS